MNPLLPCPVCVWRRICKRGDDEMERCFSLSMANRQIAEKAMEEIAEIINTHKGGENGDS